MVCPLLPAGEHRALVATRSHALRTTRPSASRRSAHRHTIRWLEPPETGGRANRGENSRGRGLLRGCGAGGARGPSPLPVSSASAACSRSAMSLSSRRLVARTSLSRRGAPLLGFHVWLLQFPMSPFPVSPLPGEPVCEHPVPEDFVPEDPIGQDQAQRPMHPAPTRSLDGRITNDPGLRWGLNCIDETLPASPDTRTTHAMPAHHMSSEGSRSRVLTNAHPSSTASLAPSSLVTRGLRRPLCGAPPSRSGSQRAFSVGQVRTGLPRPTKRETRQRWAVRQTPKLSTNTVHNSLLKACGKRLSLLRLHNYFTHRGFGHRPPTAREQLPRGRVAPRPVPGSRRRQDLFSGCVGSTDVEIDVDGRRSQSVRSHELA